MAFWGKSFVFNDVPCEDFDLILYDIDGHSQSAGGFASGVTIIEDKLPHKWKPYFYGTKTEGKLGFSIVFGVNQKRIDNHKFLDRDELDAIATWLTGHDKYMWLEIQQDDLEYIRYNCIITELKMIEYDMYPWALEATIECDSPFAYMYPQTFSYNLDGSANTINFYNESSVNGFYMPNIEIELSNSHSFSIQNVSDNNRILSFENLPVSVNKINVDNEHCIITTNDSSINPYSYFNFNFFRLIRGYNYLTINGNGVLRIICEFPINVGG